MKEVIPRNVFRFGSGEWCRWSLQNDGHRTPRRHERLHLLFGLRTTYLRNSCLPSTNPSIQDLDHRFAIGRSEHRVTPLSAGRLSEMVE